MARPVLLLPAVLLVLVTAAGGVHAATPEEVAGSLAKQGIAAYEAGDYSTAYDRFSRARATYAGDSVLLYFLGKSAEKLGRVEAAIGHYEHYLQAGPDPANVPQVEGALQKLRAARPGVIETHCRPAAGVTVGSFPAGRCPGRLEGVPPGSYSVIVEAPGHQRWTGQVVVEPGAVARLDVVLQPEPKAATTPAPAAAAAPAAGPPGTLLLQGIPRGAALAVDGEPLMSPEGRPISLPSGTHRLEVTFTGQAPLVLEVQIEPGRERKLDVGAMLLATYPAVAPAPRGAGEEAVAAAPAPAASGADARTWALAHGAAATLVGVAAAVGAWVAHSAFEEAADDGAAANGRDRVAYEDAKDRAETAGTAFYVLSGAAAVAAGWAGFVWLTLPAEAGSGRGVGGRLEWSW